MKKIYFPNLNGLRFFAALSVMVYHFFGANVLNGHFGVILFFVLSGFLITYLLIEEQKNTNTISIKKFYVRRILRIWPLYFFILILSTVLIFFETGLDNSYSQALPYYLVFIPNLAFVMNISIKYASILWSIGAEEQFYLLWPWIICKIKVKKLFLIFLIMILFWSFATHLIDFINYNYLSNIESIGIFSKFLGRMGFSAMATGALVALVFRYHPKRLQFIFHPLIQITVISLTLTIWIGNLLPHIAIIDQVYSILFAIIIANFALNSKVIFSLENVILNYLGKISFGLYVYHLIAFRLIGHLSQILSFDIPKIILFIFGLLLTITLSSISYKYLEKPFLRLKLNKFTVIKSGNDIHNKN